MDLFSSPVTKINPFYILKMVSCPFAYTLNGFKVYISVFLNLYNKTRHSYIYMSPIAGQTAGPNRLIFLDTHGYPGG